MLFHCRVVMINMVVCQQYHIQTVRNFIHRHRKVYSWGLIERKKIGFVRYITFAIAFIFVAVLFLSHTRNLERIMFIAFIVGNILYYAIGIILAFLWKDNRAFCKYICPVTVFLKPMSYFSVFRVKCDKKKCISCGNCKRVCPMEVDVTDNSRKRENGTECILCMECVKACPKKAL